MANIARRSGAPRVVVVRKVTAPLLNKGKAAKVIGQIRPRMS